MNFRHYPATVDEVIALEPESYLRARAQAAARDARVPVSVSVGVADGLPLEDGSCDKRHDPGATPTPRSPSFSPAPTPSGWRCFAFAPRCGKEALECYLEELYVVPDHRGQGIGRALMAAAIKVAPDEGAADMSLRTGEDDVAARAFYENLGFSNRESNGALNFFYEREL